MKQIIQNLSNGEISVLDTPIPSIKESGVLIATSNTVLSAGTERMLLNFGKANYINKAIQQPEKVKDVINKFLTEGPMVTFSAVKSKLDQPIPLGYCNAGIVLESDVLEIKPGDRVISNGSHAEVVQIPKNLCAKIPDNVDNESASFTVLGAIALQGIRLIEPTIGEKFVVTGLGLIGLLSVQILIANGCQVLAIDYKTSRCNLAKKYGAEVVDLSKNENPLEFSKIFSKYQGVDGVIIATSTNSNKVISQAAKMCRKKGRIVLVGVTGLNIIRDDFYKKEIKFQVSSSYGPGRYDKNYEENGNDYPIGYVRWTEQRNFETILEMISKGLIDTSSLITHRYNIEEAIEAYKLLNKPEALGIIINYPKNSDKILKDTKVELNHKYITNFKSNNPNVGFIGAGNYSSRILIPAFKKTQATLDTLVTKNGLSGTYHGKKNSFLNSSTKLDDILLNKKINTVVIATRHNSHAELVINALKNRKNIFVEKPLAINLTEIEKIKRTYDELNTENPVRLMVGFNRRFAPQVQKIKNLIQNIQEPKAMVMTVNAGLVDKDHWTQDIKIGGGRIIGEVCHFIDLLRFLVGKKIVSYKIESSNSLKDIASIQLKFSDDSIGSIHYFSNGSKSFSKEKLEIFVDGKILELDNFIKLKGFGWPNFKNMNLWKQNKGHEACAKAFIDSINNGEESPIPAIEIFETSTISIELTK